MLSTFVFLLTYLQLLVISLCATGYYVAVGRIFLPPRQIRKVPVSLIRAPQSWNDVSSVSGMQHHSSLLQIRLLVSSLNLNLVDYSLQGLGCHVTHVSHVVVFNCNIVLYNVALRHVNPVVSITSDVDLKWYSSSQSATMPYQSMTTVLKLPHNTLSTFSDCLTFAFNVCQ